MRGVAIFSHDNTVASRSPCSHASDTLPHPTPHCGQRAQPRSRPSDPGPRSWRHSPPERGWPHARPRPWASATDCLIPSPPLRPRVTHPPPHHVSPPHTHTDTHTHAHHPTSLKVREGWTGRRLSAVGARLSPPPPPARQPSSCPLLTRKTIEPPADDRGRPPARHPLRRPWCRRLGAGLSAPGPGIGVRVGHRDRGWPHSVGTV